MKLVEQQQQQDRVQAASVLLITPTNAYSLVPYRASLVHGAAAHESEES